MNLYQISTPPLDTEIVDILVQKSNLRIERILSKGQTTDWLLQEQEEFVVLLQGSALLEFDDHFKYLNAGDTILIPAHCRHRVAETSTSPECIWLCIFYTQ